MGHTNCVQNVILVSQNAQFGSKWGLSIRTNRRCRCRPISENVKSARWRLFGHVLRMPLDAPAQQAINYYFADTGVGTFRGRPRTTLPTALSADLRRVGRRPTLRCPADIDALRLLNREQWRQLERDIAEES